MINDWEAYKKEFHALMGYVRELKKLHGEDGKDVAIEDLAIRLARRRVGIDELTPYGEHASQQP